jgi:hypothetical protein
MLGGCQQENERTITVVVEVPLALHQAMLAEKYRRNPRSTIKELVAEAVAEKYRGGNRKE